MKTALLVMVHGSPRPVANGDMFRVVEEVKARAVFDHVAVGFMECNEPTIPDAVDACAARARSASSPCRTSCTRERMSPTTCRRCWKKRRSGTRTSSSRWAATSARRRSSRTSSPPAPTRRRADCTYPPHGSAAARPAQAVSRNKTLSETRKKEARLAMPHTTPPLRLLPLLVGLGLTATRLPAQTPPAPAAPMTHGVDLSTIDTSVLPCRDFYQYANGKWLAANPVPADRSTWGEMSEIGERNSAVLHSILDRAVAGPPAPPGSVERKVADFYRTGMDTARIEREGRPAAGPGIRPHRRGRRHARPAGRDRAPAPDRHPGRVGVWAWGRTTRTARTPSRSSARAGWACRTGTTTPRPTTNPAPCATPTSPMSPGCSSCSAMRPTRPQPEAQTVLGIETRLASASMTRLERRDPNATYHKLTPAQLDALTPGLSWKPYFAALGVPDPGPLLVGQPQFFTTVGGMLTSVPLADWKTYLRWHLINGTADDLSDAFVDEQFAFFGKTLSGSPTLLPRWKRVLAQTDGSLGEGLGTLYVARAFSPEAKARALALVLNLKAALHDRLQSLDWIGDDTRKQALHKLDKMTIKIGYPDRPRDYSKLAVDSPDFVTNALAARQFEFQRNLKKLGRPVDRTEWGMTAPTVNAYYRPDVNEIVFPAGILQPPFFDAQADDASNYGAIGAVIGHEMTHGFDDQGRQFDADGNLKDWWTAADKKNFQERAELVARQFDGFVAVDDLHVNGHLTLGEDIADLGGLKIAYLAFEKAQAGKPRVSIGGFTPEQRFFLAFAQVWRTNTRPEALRLRVATDPHAPARFRVLGPLANLPEFAQAFPCPAGEAAPAPASETVTIWYALHRTM